MGLQTRRIRWGRVLVATLLSEVMPVLVLVVVVALYAALSGSTEEAHLNGFAKRVGYWIGPVAGSLLTFVFSFWACRRLGDGFLWHGALIGLLSALIGVALLLVLADEFSLVFVVSYALRFTSAVLGGLVAERRFKRREETSEA